jgi:hypothetical protein
MIKIILSMILDALLMNLMLYMLMKAMSINKKNTVIYSFSPAHLMIKRVVMVIVVTKDPQVEIEGICFIAMIF